LHAREKYRDVNHRYIHNRKDRTPKGTIWEEKDVGAQTKPSRRQTDATEREARRKGKLAQKTRTSVPKFRRDVQPKEKKKVV